jgi:hypothetical protein
MSEPAPEPVTVYLTNATHTSGGAGPGPVRVPPAEAKSLTDRRIAVYGDQPPRDGTEDAQRIMKARGL